MYELKVFYDKSVFVQTYDYESIGRTKFAEACSFCHYGSSVGIVKPSHVTMIIAKTGQILCSQPFPPTTYTSQV